MEEHSSTRHSTQVLYEGDKLQYLVAGLAPGASYSFRVRVCARVGPLPSARALASLEDPWCSSKWSPSALFVTPATAPAKCLGLSVFPKEPGEVILKWDACNDNGAPVESYTVHALEAVDPSKLVAAPPATTPPTPAAAASAGGDGGGGCAWGGVAGVAGEEEWREVYSGKGLTCEVSSLSVGVSYKFRVAARNAMGTGPWGGEMIYTSRAVPPEAPPSAPQLINCLATSVDLAWQAPQDNSRGISSYTVQMQIDVSSEQVGSNPSISNLNIGLPPTPGGDGNVRLFTVDATTRLCTVGDLIVGLRYLFRVRASNEAGPGAWSGETVYIPKPGVPVIRSAPELSSAEVGHVCVEWEGADCNGMDITRYELEMAEPEVCRADAKAADRAGEPDKVAVADKAPESFEALQSHELEGKLRMLHVKELAINKRYLFRLRAVNGMGASLWSDVVSIDTVKHDTDAAIDFAAIEMGEVIGEGGFSVVYRGVWNSRQVAVKRLKVQLSES